MAQLRSTRTFQAVQDGHGLSRGSDCLLGTDPGAPGKEVLWGRQYTRKADLNKGKRG